MPSKHKKAFTLIELLVVVSIIALLIAILIPVLGSAKYEAKNLLCMNRVRQWALATSVYATDNKELYPDRGIDNDNAGEPLWARWAARMWIQRGVDEHLDDLLAQYMASETAVWCCPLYGGTHGKDGLAGCTTHGRSHQTGNSNYDRWTTYAFHGGLRQKTSSGHVYNPGDRRKFGDPYIIELADGTTYKSNILISDTASDDNAWTPCLYPDNQTGRLGNPADGPGVSTNHAPPTSRQTQRIGIANYYVLAVKGPAYTNWAYDDGSAEVRIIDPATGLNDPRWTPVQADGRGGNRRFMMFPNR